MTNEKILGVDGAPYSGMSLSEGIALREKADARRNELLHEMLRQLNGILVVQMLEAERKATQSAELYGERAPRTLEHCKAELAMLEDLYESLAQRWEQEDEEAKRQGGEEDSVG